jgi:hypothetical protein
MQPIIISEILRYKQEVNSAAFLLHTEKAEENLTFPIAYLALWKAVFQFFLLKSQ